MIKKLFILFLCFILSSCSGASYRMGIKFKNYNKLDKTKNDYYLSKNSVKLKNGVDVNFYEPMGKCGVGFSTIVILLLIVPVKFHFVNTCNNEMVITSGLNRIKELKIKYNDKIYSAFSKEIKYIEKEPFKSMGYNATFRFRIDSFKKFKSAKDKVLIITMEDGFTQEFPIEWGFIRYGEWH